MQTQNNIVKSEKTVIFEKLSGEISKGIEQISILPSYPTFGGEVPVSMVIFQKGSDFKKKFKKTGVYDLIEKFEGKPEIEADEKNPLIGTVKAMTGTKVWRPRRDIVGGEEVAYNNKMEINFFADENKNLAKMIGEGLTVLQKKLTLQNLTGKAELKAGKPTHIAVKIGSTVLCTTAVPDGRAKLPTFSKKDGKYDQKRYSEFCRLVLLLLTEAKDSGKPLQVPSDILSALGLKAKTV